MALLEVENLQTHFRTPEGINRAVDGVSFHVDKHRVQDIGQYGAHVAPVRSRINASAEMHLDNLQILAESRGRKGCH
jgi:ABC-type antimicrobial peptide transport system ATPase subunit